MQRRARFVLRTGLVTGQRTPTRYPSQIVVTSDRVRKRPGNLRGLAKTIERDGLLQPLVIRPNNELICGWRRLEAWRLLDRWGSPIPVHVVDIDAIARGEWAENVHREELTPSEKVALMRALRPALQEAARERSIVLGRHHGHVPDDTPLSKFSTGGVSEGRTMTAIAKGLGVSSRQLEKAAAVVDAAGADPVRFGPLQEAMDRSGRVHGPYSRLRVMRQADAIRAEPPPLPNRGPYRLEVIDVPWPFDPEAEDQSERGTHPYPLMTYAQIHAFGEQALSILHEDAVVAFWTTNFHMREAYRVLDTWGLTPKTVLTWGKDKFGRGRVLRERTEHCIIAVRGNPTITLSAETTLLIAPRKGHSEKPAAFYELIERVYPAPRYAELFSHLQIPRPGWDRHSPALGLEEAEPPPELDVDADVPDLVRVGDVVRTSYGTGPYQVVGVHGPLPPPKGFTQPVWGLSLAGVLDRPSPRNGRITARHWINDLVAAGGRLIGSNADEVLVDPRAPRLVEAAS